MKIFNQREEEPQKKPALRLMPNSEDEDLDTEVTSESENTALNPLQLLSTTAVSPFQLSLIRGGLLIH